MRAGSAATSRAPMILIHHIGARSGRERVNPLTYLPDGDDMVITATKERGSDEPGLVLQPEGTPRITVEVGTATSQSRRLR
jgi:hypothetical protein